MGKKWGKRCIENRQKWTKIENVYKMEKEMEKEMDKKWTKADRKWTKTDIVQKKDKVQTKYKQN